MADDLDVAHDVGLGQFDQCGAVMVAVGIVISAVCAAGDTGMIRAR